MANKTQNRRGYLQPTTQGKLQGMIKCDGSTYRLSATQCKRTQEIYITATLEHKHIPTPPLSRWQKVRKAIRRISRRYAGSITVKTQTAQKGKPQEKQA